MTQAITRSGKISNMSELCTYLCDPLCCHPVSSVVGKVSPTCLKHEVCCGRARVSHTEKNMSRLTLRRCQFPIRSADQFRSCAQSFAQKQQLWTSEVAIFTCMTHKDRGHSGYTLRLGYLWRHSDAWLWLAGAGVVPSKLSLLSPTRRPTPDQYGW